MKATAWLKKSGSNASTGTFADAAAFGQIIFNCTHGTTSIESLKLAEEKNLDGKVLVDLANPLDFSSGELKLTVSNTDSLGEQIQRAFPKARVVKALNTLNTEVQVNPSLLKEESDLFICGEDKAAKEEVTELLRSFGWKNIIDLGGIKASRGQEAILLLFVNMMSAFPKKRFNYHVVTD